MHQPSEKNWRSRWDGGRHFLVPGLDEAGVVLGAPEGGDEPRRRGRRRPE